MKWIKNSGFARKTGKTDVEDFLKPNKKRQAILSDHLPQNMTEYQLPFFTLLLYYIIHSSDIAYADEAAH